MESNICFRPLAKRPWYTEIDRRFADPGNCLEISSRSPDDRGRQLSPMALRDRDRYGEYRVEACYQQAKDFGGGPAWEEGEYGNDDVDETTLLKTPAKLNRLNGFAAKTAIRQRAAGRNLVGFIHDGLYWPSATGTAFYDLLWARGATRLEAGIGIELAFWESFTDQFHHVPGPGNACQARAAAILAGMSTAEPDIPLNDETGWCLLALGPGCYLPHQI